MKHVSIAVAPLVVLVGFTSVQAQEVSGFLISSAKPGKTWFRTGDGSFEIVAKGRKLRAHLHELRHNYVRLQAVIDGKQARVTALLDPFPADVDVTMGEKHPGVIFEGKTWYTRGEVAEALEELHEPGRRLRLKVFKHVAKKALIVRGIPARVTKTTRLRNRFRYWIPIITPLNLFAGGGVPASVVTKGVVLGSSRVWITGKKVDGLYPIRTRFRKGYVKAEKVSLQVPGRPAPGLLQRVKSALSR